MPNIQIIWGTVDSDEVAVRTVGDQQKQVAEFRVYDGATWITVVAWEDLAKIAAPLKKGDYLIVHGKQRTRSYEKDGSKRYVTETVASSITPVGAAAAVVDDDVIPD